jgi:hypothetical protein
VVLLWLKIQTALDEGWQATNARERTYGKTFVFEYAKEWEGSFYAEKEVTVYYKPNQDGIILLTVIARYGDGFKRGGST